MLSKNEQSKNTISNPPGGPIVWFVACYELFVFAIIFVYIIYFKNTNSVLFGQATQHLDLQMGILYTIILITSGWMTALSVHFLHKNEIKKTKFFYLLGILIGLAFLVIKGIDFYLKFSSGQGLGTDSFWDLYILTTGFHYFHVIAALFIMIIVHRSLSKKGIDNQMRSSLVTSAVFWHFCDVIWLFIFPLFYLAR